MMHNQAIDKLNYRILLKWTGIIIICIIVSIIIGNILVFLLYAMSLAEHTQVNLFLDYPINIVFAIFGVTFVWTSIDKDFEKIVHKQKAIVWVGFLSVVVCVTIYTLLISLYKQKICAIMLKSNKECYTPWNYYLTVTYLLSFGVSMIMVVYFKLKTITKAGTQNL